MSNILNVMGQVSPNNVSATAERIASYFANHNITSAIFGSPDSDVENAFQLHGIETVFIGSPTFRGQLNIAWEAIAGNHSYDLYHVFGGLLHTPAVQLIRYITGVPIITRFNGYHNPSGHLSSIPVNILERELLQRSDAVVFNSHHQMNDILREHGMVTQPRYYVIPPGVEESLFTRTPETDMQKLRSVLSIPKEAFILGTCQTPRPVKQPKKAIDLVNLLNRCGKEQQVHLIFVGDSEHVTKYKQYSHDCGVAEMVHWVGQQSHSELSRWYSLFDVTILTSLSESFGLSVTESFLCETPCVAFRVGGMADQIDHGGTGYLVRPGDITLMESSVSTLLKDPEKCRAFGRAGRKEAAERFTLSQSASQYQRLIKRVSEQ